MTSRTWSSAGRSRYPTAPSAATPRPTSTSRTSATTASTATPRPTQARRRRAACFAFQVMDDDYAPVEFPDYADPRCRCSVTAAHEYNHVLQYGYDACQDTWMFESTATWAEDKVFDASTTTSSTSLVGDVPGSRSRSRATARAPSADDLKMYGSAIWNHWLERRYGPESSGGRGSSRPVADRRRLRAQAYEQAIREVGPAASFASGVRRRSPQPLPSGRRPTAASARARFALPPYVGAATSRGPDGAGVRHAQCIPVDHTAFALYDVAVPVPSAPPTSAWSARSESAAGHSTAASRSSGSQEQRRQTSVMDAARRRRGRRSHAPDPGASSESPRSWSMPTSGTRVRRSTTGTGLGRVTGRSGFARDGGSRAVSSTRRARRSPPGRRPLPTAASPRSSTSRP